MKQSRYNKEKAIMIGLIIILSIILLKNTTGADLEPIISKDAVFTSLKENTANTGTATFTMNNPETLALTKEALQINFREDCGKVKDYKIYTTATCTRTEPIIKNTETCETIINKTTDKEENKCITTEEITGYQEINYSCEKEIPYITSGTKDYKIKANIQIGKCGNSWGYKIDWLPTLNTETKGTITQESWAWWNISYPFRRLINCSGFTTPGIPILINQSYGTNLNSTNIKIWIDNCTTESTYIYYGDSTHYAIAQTDLIPFQTKSADGINYSTENLYSNQNGVYHLESTTIQDDTYNHYNGTTKGTLTTGVGVIGGAINLTGTTNWAKTGKNLGETKTLSLWFYTPTAISKTSTAQVIWSNSTTSNLFFAMGNTGAAANAYFTLYQHALDKGYSLTDGGSISVGWHFLLLTHNGARWEMWLDNVNKTTTASASGIYTGLLNDKNGFNMTLGYYEGWGFANELTGLVDELILFHNQLNTSDINALYQNQISGGNLTYGSLEAQETNSTTAPALEQQIIFVNQDPLDITSTNIISSRANITYNITGNYTYNSSNPYLNYSIAGAEIYINGSAYTTYRQQNAPANSSNFYSFYLNDNQVYPGTYLINETKMENTIHSNYDLNGASTYIMIQLRNISRNKNYNFIEIMLNTSSAITTADIFYCNNNWAYTINKAENDNTNCVLIAQENRQSFNHTHNQSQHQVYNFPINSTGFINGVNITSNGRIVIKTNTGTSTIGRINEAPPSATTTAISGPTGIAWLFSDFVDYTPDIHLHQYDGTENLTYQACMRNSSASLTCSALRTDNLNLTRIPPTTPLITNPTSNNGTQKKNINITYNPALPYLSTTNISYYNITLWNSDLTFNRSIKDNNSINLWYYWNIYKENLTIGNYYLKVMATDTNGLTSFYLTNFSINKNAELNISAKNIITNISITSFKINITSITTGIKEDYDSTDNQTIIDIIKGHNYNVSIDALGYELKNITFNATINTENYTFQLYTNNSLRINIYDESTFNLINDTLISITFNNNISQTTYTTSNGTYFKEGLTAGNWEIRFYSTSYAYRTYTLTIENRTSYELNAYLISSNYTTIFTIKDCATLNLLSEATFTMEKLGNSSYTIVESKLSDITGRVQVAYLGATEYRFTISKTGYSSKVFYLDPVIFSAYSVCLEPTTTLVGSEDYGQISIVYYPRWFFNEQINPFTFIISNPNSTLQNYTIRLSAPGSTGNNQYATGSTGIGESFLLNLNVSGAKIGDYVNLTYTYRTATSGTRTFRYRYEIIGWATGNNTIASIKTSNYGLGLFETSLLATIVIVIVIGLSYALVGMGGALVLGLLLQGIAVYLGFLPLASILISVFVGILLLASTSIKN